MDERVQRVSEGLQEMIQPYLGRREYGDLCIVGKTKKLPTAVEEDMIMWILNYEMVLSSSSPIDASFLPQENVFEYSRHPDNAKTRTENPEEVLNYFKTMLGLIKPQRREHLMGNARLKKEGGVPLEKAVTDMKEFAQKAQRFGPTVEELELYEQFCYEVYSTE